MCNSVAWLADWDFHASIRGVLRRRFVLHGLETFVALRLIFYGVWYRFGYASPFGTAADAGEIA